MSRFDEFNAYRPQLFSIAYRMLGSRADAEDAVQETFLRWQKAGAEEVRSPRSYLAAIVTRLCVDTLRSARVQREEYTGPWLPEPMITDHRSRPDLDLELAESLTMAFMIMLESLSPLERAGFLLREVFDYDYPEIAEILGKSEASCRQMIHRAKERVSERRHRFEPSQEETDRLAATFLQAARTGDVQTLMSLFAEDAVMMSDGGGNVRAALNPVYGPDAIARFVVGVVRKGVPADATITQMEINGQVAFVILHENQTVSATILDIDGDKIRNLFIIVNPVKLRGLISPS